MKRISKTSLFLALILIFLFSCASKKENSFANDENKPTIAVVNYPLFYFAKAIGGEMVKVDFPKIDDDPAYWIPNSTQVNDFQQADLILANGAGYEKWMEKVSLPSSKIVITSMSFKDQWIEVNEGVAHSHGAAGEHVHMGTAFTTWLDFGLATKQASSVHNAISALLPKNNEALNRNFEQLQKDLGILDNKMKAIAKKIKGRQMIVSHPVYQYLKKGYGLPLISVHWEANELPTAEMWKALENTISDHGVGIMIWESEPLEEIKSKLEQLNISIAVFDPCANTPDSGDFMDVMKENVERLSKVVALNY